MGPPVAGAGEELGVQGSVVLTYWFIAGLGLALGGGLGLIPVLAIYRRWWRRS